ncbi:uncharacterized protein BYT42DRAFT_498144 [Radiomyces spectabilis]|uniref:uncharacterized protein n=1 Tax=Radiomyces spectabilis TaxID=64574 RepID=UPI00221EB271|nr:uncharacterized protein BYT42DRAFT_498144 [Radiomyces spectabilis]KAI8376402.1 hypothetical protein BYT42DRAFT_498144 [Radiomyces spectabilis]
MPLTDADLLASLRDFSQCNETLICKVRTTVLEPFQPDVRPEALSRAVKPSSAEFKTMTVRLAPLAMRIMNENINSLRRLKESRQEKLYNRSAIVTCLIDTSLYAFAALKHMNAYTTLKPLDLEKTMSNLIGKIVDLGEYGRALEELRKFRTNLANIANVQFDSHPPMSSKSKLVSPVSASPRASKGVLTEMLNRGNDDLRMTVSDTWMGKHGHMSSWDDDMLQKYGDLFNFPLDPSINNPTMILLVLAYQMNSLRCWCDIKDGALLKYLPMLLSRSGNFLDCCALLKKFDPITSRKQFDSLQRMLFRAASKFPSSGTSNLPSNVCCFFIITHSFLVCIAFRRSIITIVLSTGSGSQSRILHRNRVNSIPLFSPGSHGDCLRTFHKTT